MCEFVASSAIQKTLTSKDMLTCLETRIAMRFTRSRYDIFHVISYLRASSAIALSNTSGWQKCSFIQAVQRSKYPSFIITCVSSPDNALAEVKDNPLEEHVGIEFRELIRRYHIAAEPKEQLCMGEAVTHSILSHAALATSSNQPRRTGE